MPTWQSMVRNGYHTECLVIPIRRNFRQEKIFANFTIMQHLMAKFYHANI